jgi:hypothetical protein
MPWGPMVRVGDQVTVLRVLKKHDKLNEQLGARFSLITSTYMRWMLAKSNSLCSKMDVGMLIVRVDPLVPPQACH